MVGMVDRYMNDPQVKALVDCMQAQIESLNFTPSEVRDCAMLATIRYEQQHSRQIFNVENSNSPATPVQQTKVTTCPNCKSNFTTGDGVKRWCRDCGESWDDGKQ